MPGRVGDFLLVIIELFFARCFRFVTIHAFDRRTDRQNLDSNTVRMLRSRTVIKTRFYSTRCNERRLKTLKTLVALYHTTRMTAVNTYNRLYRILARYP